MLNGFILGHHKSFAPVSPLLPSVIISSYFRIIHRQTTGGRPATAIDGHLLIAKRTSQAIIARIKHPVRCSHQRNHKPWEELEARIIVCGCAWFNSISINMCVWVLGSHAHRLYKTTMTSPRNNGSVAQLDLIIYLSSLVDPNPWAEQRASTSTLSNKRSHNIETRQGKEIEINQ